MSNLSEDAEILTYSMYFYSLLIKHGNKSVSYDQAFSGINLKVVDDEIVLPLGNILTRLVKYMPDIFSICSKDDDLYNQIKKFADFLAEYYGAYYDDYTDNMCSHITTITDVNMNRVLPEIYTSVHTFFTHYIDYLIHIGEIKQAGNLFKDQLHNWSRGVTYACQFVSRYCKTYDDIETKIDLLPQVFKIDTKLYMLLVANLEKVHQYLATDLVVLRPDIIPNISPFVVKKNFDKLVMRCLDQEYVSTLIKLLYEQKSKDNSLSETSLLESYPDEQVNKKIKSLIKFMKK